MRGRERVRGGASRAHLGWPRRLSLLPAERYSRGGWAAGREPQMGRDIGEWIE
ncbi:hypothetical protein A2U01_0070134, partial [Trifolium medium]|nr:hypothetical protein [Trifolium medium]